MFNSTDLFLLMLTNYRKVSNYSFVKLIGKHALSTYPELLILFHIYFNTFVD